MAAFTAFLVLCLVTVAAAARNSVFTIPEEKTITEHIATFNAQLGQFEFRNETRPAPRKTLGLGQGVDVSVTFYNSPGMDCETGNGQCGFGNDVNGDARGHNGGSFVETSLYPYHCASGNYGLLGGCGACGVLTYNGKARGFVVTDITDHKDDIGGDGQHIDLCLPSFNYFTDGAAGRGNHGGIFTGHWTRVDCSCMGSPNYPDHAIVVRTQRWNEWAKAVVISRLGSVGEIASVNFRTRKGGFTRGAKVEGWGAWWAPTANLGGQGGVTVEITLTNGASLPYTDYPLPDYNLWETGAIYNIFANVPSQC